MTDAMANPFHEWLRLEQPRLGTRVVEVSDDFFGAVARLIEPADPVFIPGKYDEHGKWMDGWESRRRRGPGHDWCVIRLGVPGIVHGVDIDTRHFTGNFAPAAALEACHADTRLPAAAVQWHSLLAETPLSGDCHNYLPVTPGMPVTHLRLNIYPDGGVARLRIYGEVRPDLSRLEPGRATDLLALHNGGRALACSDEHYGSMHNLNAPGRALNMGDGWETARRRGPGHDWVMFALGATGRIESIEIDTAHFKGNYPDQVAIDGILLDAPPADPGAVATGDHGWRTLLPQTRVEADRVHVFRDTVRDIGPVSHVRLNIYPDGGVARLRLLGHVGDGAER